MNPELFLEQIYRLLNLYHAAQKQPRRYSGNITLYAAEAHMVEIIGSQPGIMGMELAERLFISKGAVSQTLKKLLEKGLVYKNDAADGRAARLYLTDAGGIIWQEHRRLHQPMLNALSQLTAQFSPETASALDQLGAIFEKHLTQITMED